MEWEKMNAKKKKKKVTFPRASRAEPRSIRSPAPAPRCAEAFPSQNHPPTQPASLPVPPEARASHQSTWPPPRLLVCVSASDCTKTSGPGGRDTSEAGQDVEGSRGERGDEGERQPQHHVHEEEKKGRKRKTPECQLPALQRGGGPRPERMMELRRELEKALLFRWCPGREQML